VAALVETEVLVEVEVVVIKLTPPLQLPPKRTLLLWVQVEHEQLVSTKTARTELTVSFLVSLLLVEEEEELTIKQVKTEVVVVVRVSGQA